MLSAHKLPVPLSKKQELFPSWALPLCFSTTFLIWDMHDPVWYSISPGSAYRSGHSKAPREARWSGGQRPAPWSCKTLAWILALSLICCMNLDELNSLCLSLLIYIMEMIITVPELLWRLSYYMQGHQICARHLVSTMYLLLLLFQYYEGIPDTTTFRHITWILTCSISPFPANLLPSSTVSNLF